MAIPEKGEYFVVRRGFKLNTESLSSVLFPREPWQGQPEALKEPRYDRSYEGDLFLAVEVCGDAVVAKLVHRTATYRPGRKGDLIVLSAADMELWPVTKAFAEAMGVDNG